MSKRKYAILFIIGTIAWYIIEVIFRFIIGSDKVTHLITCFIAGYALIMAVKVAHTQRWVIAKTLLLGLSITLLELALGATWIYVFKLPRLWDYGNQFLSLNGIICFKWAMLWIGLSASLVFLLRKLRK